MEIRTCTNKDLTDCAKLLVEVYSEPPYNESWTLADAEAYLARFYTIEPAGCLVAVDASLQGAVFTYSYPWQRDRLVYIQELFVSSSNRCRGIASSLLKAVTKGKRVKGWLVANENTPAAEFYRSLGFTQNGPYRFFSGLIGEQ